MNTYPITNPVAKLDWDSTPDAISAHAAGWRLDYDDWWWRDRTESSMILRDGVAHFGFTTEQPGYLGKVYVRAAAYALDYDRGIITEYAPLRCAPQGV